MDVTGSLRGGVAALADDMTGKAGGDALDAFMVSREEDSTAHVRKGGIPSGNLTLIKDAPDASALSTSTGGAARLRVPSGAARPAAGATKPTAAEAALPHRGHAAGGRAASAATNALKDRARREIEQAVQAASFAGEETAPADGDLAERIGDAPRTGAGALRSVGRGAGSVHRSAGRGIAKAERRRASWGAKASARTQRAASLQASADSFLAKADRAEAGGFARSWYQRRAAAAQRRARADLAKADHLRALAAGRGVTGRISALRERVARAVHAATGGKALLLAGGAFAGVVAVLVGILVVASLFESVAGGSASRSANLAAPVPGQTIIVPDGMGRGGFTVTMYGTLGFYAGGVWSIAQGTPQADVHDLWKRNGAKFEDGIAAIKSGGETYLLIACTPTFGAVGDYVFFTLEDGTVIKGIVADAKNLGDPGCNAYGHNNGANVVEFEVDWRYFSQHGNPGTPGWHPEWAGKRVVSGTNMGSVFNGDPTGSVSAGTATAEAILAAARRQIGSVYVWAASDPASKRFDCSGLTSYAYGQAGISIPHQSEMQRDSAPIRLPAAQAKPGDILWMSGHVALCAGPGTIIDATPSRGVALRSSPGFSMFTYALRWPAVNGTS